MLANTHVPDALWHSHTIPIPKEHDIDIRNPSNYRGISLLSTIAEVFEKIILSNVQPTTKLNPLEGGFHPGYSCLQTVFVLQTAIKHTRKSKKEAYVAYLIARKAFVTVWHKGLFAKIHQKGFPHCIWHLLKNTLTPLAWCLGITLSQTPFLSSKESGREPSCPRSSTRYLLTN